VCGESLDDKGKNLEQDATSAAARACVLCASSPLSSSSFPPPGGGTQGKGDRRAISEQILPAVPCEASLCLFKEHRVKLNNIFAAGRAMPLIKDAGCGWAVIFVDITSGLTAISSWFLENFDAAMPNEQFAKSVNDVIERHSPLHGAAGPEEQKQTFLATLLRAIVDAGADRLAWSIWKRSGG